MLQRAVFINKNQDATTNECYNEQFLSIKLGCFNERMLQRKNATTNECYNEQFLSIKSECYN